MQIIRRIDSITNWLLAAIVVIPFVLSATALNDLAAQNGQRPSWLYPIMVDGGLIIFKLLVLRAALRGHRDRYAWTMAITATVISIVLNVHHAEATVTARFMSALPPLSILAAFIAVTRRVEDTAVEEGLDMERANVQASLDKLAAELAEKRRTFDKAVAEMQAAYESERTRLAGDVDRLAGQIEVLKRQKADTVADRIVRPVDKIVRPVDTAEDKVVRQPDNLVRPADTDLDNGAANGVAHGGQIVTTRQRQILDMLRQDMAQEDIAAALGVSERTVRRDIGRLNGVVKESVV